jgi:outer membrane lipoprotein-sorting protein
MLRRFVCAVWLLGLMAQGQTASTNLSADQIAAQMEKMNSLRAQSPLRIACERTYALDYEGFLGSRHAEMRVHAEQQGDEKKLTIVDESGSNILRTKVLHKLLDGEREASEANAHAGNKLSRANYDFKLKGVEPSQSRPLYILEITPRTKSKFAWKGRIWVDSVDYAVARAEGEPDKLPSWWTTHSEFKYTNQKIDGLWLPEQNVSDTHIRMGGQAHLRIGYGACQAMALDTPSSPPIAHVEAQQ